MKFSISNALVAILAVVFTLSLIKSYKKDDVINNLRDSNLALNLEKQTFDSVKNELNQTVTLQEAVIVSTQEEIRRISDEKFQLSKKLAKKTAEVLYYQSQASNIQIVEVPVPYTDTLALEQFSDSVREQCNAVIQYYEAVTVTVPRTVILDSLSTEYKNGFRFSGTVEKSRFVINKATFLDSQYIRVIEKKRTLMQFLSFKKREIEVQVLHTSPYLTVTSQNSVIYRPKKGGRVIEKALLIGAGIFLGSKLK